jgi:hypothetical protein
MRCKAMLQNVASDNKKIARRVLGDSVCEGAVFVFKASRLYLLAVLRGCRMYVKVDKFVFRGLALAL